MNLKIAGEAFREKDFDVYILLSRQKEGSLDNN